MDFLKRLNTMYWHDGVFLRSQVTITHEMTLDLEIELYDNETEATRKKIDFQFMGVENLLMTMSTKELLDNACAGNINYAYYKPSTSPKKYRFVMFLMDGMISFDFLLGKVVSNE